MMTATLFISLFGLMSLSVFNYLLLAHSFFFHALQRKSHFISCACGGDEVHLHSHFHPDSSIIFQIGHSSEKWEITSYTLKEIKTCFQVAHILGPWKEL